MDPAPDPLHGRFPTAPSVISERMTDVVSEDGDEYYPEGVPGAAARAPGQQSPAGSGSRPSSPPTSYRGFGKRRGQHAFGGPGLSMANSSRQPTAAGAGPTRGSASHAPSITSRAFFRPMSSQRLQAQRNSRNTAAVPEVAPRLSSSTAPRPSVDSANIASLRRPDTAGVPPSSRGTDFTERDPRDRELFNASPTGARFIQSSGESTSPLHPPSEHRPAGDEEKEEAKPELQPQGSTSQFRSTFLRLSKNSPLGPVQTSIPHQERRSNESMSPHLHEKMSGPTALEAGRNHEYFTGNTAFCWGGRLQNTRERPINILTGTMVVIPSVFYFVFAYAML